jgi:hypothetical protein
LHEQRLDETEVGAGTTAVLVDARRPTDWVNATSPQDVAAWLGMDARGDGMLEAHYRELPEIVREAARGIDDPDARVLAMMVWPSPAGSAAAWQKVATTATLIS